MYFLISKLVCTEMYIYLMLVLGVVHKWLFKIKIIIYELKNVNGTHRYKSVEIQNKKVTTF